MFVKFVSNGTEIKIITNEVIEGKRAFHYNAIFQVRPGIINFGYQSEYPYSSFNNLEVNPVVIRNFDQVKYVLYRLSSTNYANLHQSIQEIELEQETAPIFKLIKGDLTFKDNEMVESTILYKLGRSVDSTFNNTRSEDPIKLIYHNEYEKIEKKLKLKPSENDLKLFNLITDKTEDTKYVAAIDLGQGRIKYVEVDFNNWILDDKTKEESYVQFKNYLLENCNRVYEVTENGMSLVWQLEE